MDRLPLEVVAFDKDDDIQVVPAIHSYTDLEGACFKPDFRQRGITTLDIKTVYVHPDTRLERDSKPAFSPADFSMRDTINLLEKVMRIGIDNLDDEPTKGITAEYRVIDGTGIGNAKAARLLGPDVAILECSVPHKLPFFEIAEPLNQEKQLLHINGLAGIRYANDDPSDACAGGAFPYEGGGIVFAFKPAMYAQRFKCFNSAVNGPYKLHNRVFMKIQDEEFFINDQVYPGAPKGFGLLADGDSGAGAVLCKGNTPYLAGIVSAGYPHHVFGLMMYHIAKAADNPALLEDVVYRELSALYIKALKTTERNEKWYITQEMQDLTHMKVWIKSIIALISAS